MTDIEGAHLRQESRVRSLATRQGYRVRKSRRQWSLNNRGEYMLIDIDTNVVVFGWSYDASLDDIEDWFRQEA